MDNIQFLAVDTALWNGTYVVKKVLGHGGFGITYLAYDTSLDKNVALKEFFPGAFCSRDSDSGGVVTTSAAASEEFIARFKDKFLKEARRMAKLNHPNLVRVQTAFEENSTAYYVMDYIDGGNLQDLVKKNGPLSFNVAMKYIRQVGNALDYLHSQRMNHLDVKPANIMLRSDDTVALIDFGLSKQYDTRGNQTSTTPVGISHGYAPIEQYSQDGIKDFSASTDVYSLAATLYYLLSGTVPPASTELLDSELSFPASIPQNIRPALQKAMNPRRKERFQSAKDFINALTNPAADDDGATQILTHNNNADATQIISGPKVISTPAKPLGTKEESGSKEIKISFTPKTGLMIGGGVILVGLLIWLIVATTKSKNTSSFSLEDTTPVETVVEEVVEDSAAAPAEEAPAAQVEEEEQGIVNNSPYPVAPGSHSFEGKAEGQWPIVVYLNVSESGNVSGKMAYKSTLRKYGDKPKNYMSLNGYFSGNQMILTGYYDNGSEEDWTLNCSDNGTKYSLDGQAYSHNKDKYFSINVRGK